MRASRQATAKGFALKPALTFGKAWLSARRGPYTELRARKVGLPNLKSNVCLQRVAMPGGQTVSVSLQWTVEGDPHLPEMVCPAEEEKVCCKQGTSTPGLTAQVHALLAAPAGAAR